MENVVLTTEFVHVEELQIGSADSFDDEGVTRGLAVVVHGQDNETGEPRMFTLLVPFNIVADTHARVAHLLAPLLHRL